MTIYKVIHVVVDPKTGKKRPGHGVIEYHLTKEGALKACTEFMGAIVEMASGWITGFEIKRMVFGYSVRMWNKHEETTNEITARAVELKL